MGYPRHCLFQRTLDLQQNKRIPRCYCSNRPILVPSNSLGELRPVFLGFIPGSWYEGSPLRGPSWGSQTCYRKSRGGWLQMLLGCRVRSSSGVLFPIPSLTPAAVLQLQRWIRRRLHYLSHYILTETPASASEKKFTNLEPLTPGSQFIQSLIVTEVVISSSARLFIASNATEQALL